MKIFKSLMILVLLVGILPFSPVNAFAESATLTATISIVVLGTAQTQPQQPPDVQGCLESQLQKNPQSVPQIKVEELALNSESSAGQSIRYSICEKF